MLSLKKDGSKINGKVIEIGTENIKYNKQDSPNGPVYSVLKSDIIKIVFENGKTEIIQNISLKSLEINFINAQTYDNILPIWRYSDLYNLNQNSMEYKY